MAVQTKKKRLGAAASGGVSATASTLVDNTATAGDEIVTSTIAVCNTSGSPQTFRLGTSTTTSFEASGYFAYEIALEAYETWTWTIGVCLDVSCRYLLFSASSTSVVASAFGAKTTGNV